jgi:hypothetical protein
VPTAFIDQVMGVEVKREAGNIWTKCLIWVSLEKYWSKYDFEIFLIKKQAIFIQKLPSDFLYPKYSLTVLLKFERLMQVNTAS